MKVEQIEVCEPGIVRRSTKDLDFVSDCIRVGAHKTDSPKLIYFEFARPKTLLGVMQCQDIHLPDGKQLEPLTQDQLIACGIFERILRSDNDERISWLIHAFGQTLNQAVRTYVRSCYQRKPSTKEQRARYQRNFRIKQKKRKAAQELLAAPTMP